SRWRTRRRPARVVPRHLSPAASAASLGSPSYDPQPMSPPAGRALLASVALAAALLLAWLVPLVAIVVVWPILLFTPGWVLIAGLRSRIDAAGRLGLAVILTVAISTHLVHWLSHLSGGYSRGVVFAVAALLAVTVPIALLRGIHGPTVRTLRSAVPALAVA